MGTSTSQPSPDTPNWRIARQVLGRNAAPLERQSEELWKAAAADRAGRLSEELASPVLAAAGAVAAQSTSVSEAVRSFNRIAAEQRAVGVTLEMGRRALARAVLAGEGAAGFGAELFAETASYYASRDLSGLVGATGRVSTSGDSIALKDGLRDIARGAAREAPVRTDTEGGRFYGRATLQTLTRGGRGRGTEGAKPAAPRGGDTR